MSPFRKRGDAPGTGPRLVEDFGPDDAWLRRAIAGPFDPSREQLMRIEGTVRAAFRAGRQARDTERRVEPISRRVHPGAWSWLAIAATVILAFALIATGGAGRGGGAERSPVPYHDAVNRTPLPTAHPTQDRDLDRESETSVGVSSRKGPAPADARLPRHCRSRGAASAPPIGDPPR